MTDKGFNHHRSEEHNLWDYLYFMYYLEKKNVADLSSVENHVDHCIRYEETSWLPTDNAISLLEIDAELTAEGKIDKKFDDFNEMTQNVIEAHRKVFGDF